jgi:hypothetical protein
MGYKNYASPTAKAGTSAGGSSSGNSGAAKKADSGSSGSGDADKKKTQPKSKMNDNNWACNYYKIFHAEAKAKKGDVET